MEGRSLITTTNKISTTTTDNNINNNNESGIVVDNNDNDPDSSITDKDSGDQNSNSARHTVAHLIKGEDEASTKNQDIEVAAAASTYSNQQYWDDDEAASDDRISVIKHEESTNHRIPYDYDSSNNVLYHTAGGHSSSSSSSLTPLQPAVQSSRFEHGPAAAAVADYGGLVAAAAAADANAAMYAIPANYYGWQNANGCGGGLVYGGAPGCQTSNGGVGAMVGQYGAGAAQNFMINGMSGHYSTAMGYYEPPLADLTYGAGVADGMIGIGYSDSLHQSLFFANPNTAINQSPVDLDSLASSSNIVSKECVACGKIDIDPPNATGTNCATAVAACLDPDSWRQDAGGHYLCSACCQRASVTHMMVRPAAAASSMYGADDNAAARAANVAAPDFVSACAAGAPNRSHGAGIGSKFIKSTSAAGEYRPALSKDIGAEMSSGGRLMSAAVLKCSASKKAVERPPNMRKEGIQTRKRKQKSAGGNSGGLLATSNSASVVPSSRNGNLSCPVSLSSKSNCGAKSASSTVHSGSSGKRSKANRNLDLYSDPSQMNIPPATIAEAGDQSSTYIGGPYTIKPYVPQYSNQQQQTYSSPILQIMPQHDLTFYNNFGAMPAATADGSSAWISIPASEEQIMMSSSASTAYYASQQTSASSSTFYGSSMGQAQNVGVYTPSAFNAVSAQYLYDPASTMCIDKDVGDVVVGEDAEATARLETANRRYAGANEGSTAAAISPVSVVESEYASSSTSTPSAMASDNNRRSAGVSPNLV